MHVACCCVCLHLSFLEFKLLLFNVIQAKFKKKSFVSGIQIRTKRVHEGSRLYKTSFLWLVYDHVADHSLSHLKCMYFESITQFEKNSRVGKLSIISSGWWLKIRIVSLLHALPSKV
jgi:hypothetical protein